MYIASKIHVCVLHMNVYPNTTKNCRSGLQQQLYNTSKEYEDTRRDIRGRYSSEHQHKHDC